MNDCSLPYPTRFEDLPHEIIYELFDYLDIFDIYYAFLDLNNRFRALLTDSNFPIKLQISSIAKSDFDYYNAKLITVHSHRIISLHITNELIYDLPLSPLYLLRKFVRLKTLVLENLHEKYLDQILSNISCLSHLQTLTLNCTGHIRNLNGCVLKIFQLRALKYCQICFSSCSRPDLLPFATIEHSPIENLIIKHSVYIQQIDRLLSHVPRLSRLSLEHLWYNDLPEFNKCILIPRLTCLSLKMNQISFDNFEILVKYFCVKLQVLFVCTHGEEEYLNPFRWEELITTSMPCLRIFNIDIQGYLRDASILRLDQFHSSFWVDRRWFFFHDGLRRNNWYSVRLYSINPFRQKHYRFDMSKYFYMDPHRTNINFKVVRHISLIGNRSIVQCQYRFGNATELTLDRVTSTNFDKDVIALQQILSLNNLRKLEITSPEYPFSQLIQLLSLMHNLNSLKIHRIYWSNETDFNTVSNSDLFHSVSKVNMIRTLVIADLTDVKEVRLLFMLCPRLQYLTIHKQQRHALAIVRLLATRFNNIAQHLILLSLLVNNRKCLESLKQFLQTREYLQHFFLKVEKTHVFLWR